MVTSQDSSTPQCQSQITKIFNSSFGNLKFIHINLNHSKLASRGLKVYLVSVNMDVTLLQDAYFKDGKAPDIPLSTHDKEEPSDCWYDLSSSWARL